MEKEKILDISIRNVAFKVDASFSPKYWRDINSGSWERHTFDIIDYFVSSTNLALDIGCWAGPLSLYMAAKGANVLCIDPDPVAHQALLNNLDLNPELRTRIRPFQVAIAPNDQNVQLYARKAYGHSSTSLLKRTRDQITSSQAEGCTLDRFTQNAQINKIDFIKMDIEGGEFVILDDLIRTLKKYDFPTLYLSLHFSQLNEAIYGQKIGWRPLSLLMIKLEEQFGFRLFSKLLVQNAKQIIQLARCFKYTYNQFGDSIPLEILTHKYLLSEPVDLVLSNKRWDK